MVIQVQDLPDDEKKLLDLVREIKRASGFGQLERVMIKNRKVVSVEKAKENISFE